MTRLLKAAITVFLLDVFFLPAVLRLQSHQSVLSLVAVIVMVVINLAVGAVIVLWRN